MTLSEFLLARIAEDESAAHYALTRDGALPSDRDWGGWWLGHYQHYSRHAPDRVLAECEAKRRIVELHGGEHVCWQPDYPVDGDFAETTRWGDCATMRYLAAVYSDHPDHRGEWRP